MEASSDPELRSESGRKPGWSPETQVKVATKQVNGTGRRTAVRLRVLDRRETTRGPGGEKSSPGR